MVINTVTLHILNPREIGGFSFLLSHDNIYEMVTELIKLINMSLKELTNFMIMNKTTSSIISFLLIGLVVFGGRRLGLGLLERVIAVIIVLGLFELIKSKLKK